MNASVVFDRAAHFYDDTRGFPPGIEYAVAKRFQAAGRIMASTHIVEPGIGTGRIALPVAQLTGATITGVDLSALMLKQLHTKQSKEAIHTIQADATQMPLKSQAFDIAVITHVFHLIPDWRAALAEIERVLKPNGLLLYSWTIHEDTAFLAAWRRVLKKRTGVRYEDFSRTPFLDSMSWQRAGEVQRVIYHTERTPQDYIDSLKNRIWSSTWHMSDEEIAQRVTTLIAAAREHNLSLDDPLRQEAQFYIAPYAPPA